MNQEIICPACGSKNVKHIAYGLLQFESPEAQKKFYEKNIMGGCKITPNQPHSQCSNCKNKF